MQSRFGCEWSQVGHAAAWVHLTGELDLAAAPQLEQTLRDVQRCAALVALDLRGLIFMDLSGLHVIVDANARARGAGGRLVIIRGPLQVDAPFTLTGICDQVEILDLDASEPALLALLRLAPGGATA